MVRADIFGAEVIHTDGFAGIVLDDHQDRQHAILIRIDFSKSNLYLFAGFVRFDADGELVVGLVMGERVRGPRFERRGSLVRRERGGDTHKESQTFENKRHLFPLPSPSGVRAACPLIVFPLPRLAQPRILAEFAATLWFPSALI